MGREHEVNFYYYKIQATEKVTYMHAHLSTTQLLSTQTKQKGNCNKVIFTY